MTIKKDKYLGHEYEIQLCDPNGKWGDKAGKFYASCAILKTSTFHSTYEAAINEVLIAIEDFNKTIPQTKEEWLYAMSRCMVWTGYEECELDESMVWSLLEKAALYLYRAKEEKEENK